MMIIELPDEAATAALAARLAALERAVNGIGVEWGVGIGQRSEETTTT
jgi:hypothetical protein